MNDEIPYDPDMLQKFAQRLYAQATIVLVLFVLIGAIGAFSLFSQEHPALAAISLVVGVALGFEISFWLKLRAQLVLCQWEMEKHLRSQRLARINAETPQAAQAIAAPDEKSRAWMESQRQKAAGPKVWGV